MSLVSGVLWAPIGQLQPGLCITKASTPFSSDIYVCLCVWVCERELHPVTFVPSNVALCGREWCEHVERAAFLWRWAAGHLASRGVCWKRGRLSLPLSLSLSLSYSSFLCVCLPVRAVNSWPGQFLLRIQAYYLKTLMSWYYYWIFKLQRA